MLDMARVAPDRVAVYGIENHAGTPVYVHAKTCIVDDTWATIGSDNFNRRSWTHDSELSAVVVDTAGEYARTLRLTLAAEHLDREPRRRGRTASTPRACSRRTPSAPRRSTAGTPAGRVGPRPPGRLRRLQPPELGRVTRAVGAGALPDRARPGRTAQAAAQEGRVLGQHGDGEPCPAPARRRARASPSAASVEGVRRADARRDVTGLDQRGEPLEVARALLRDPQREALAARTGRRRARGAGGSCR